MREKKLLQVVPMMVLVIVMAQIFMTSSALLAAEAPEPGKPEAVPPPVLRGGGTPEGIRAEFKALDADGDGALSEREYARAFFARREFMGADKDRDGKLSREEYASYVPPVLAAVPGQGAFERWEELFDSLDKDKSGDITESEAGQAWNMLRQADANGDGKVTKEEQGKARENREKRTKERRAAEFAQLDKDGDGSLSFVELLGQTTFMPRVRAGEVRAPAAPGRLPAVRDRLRAMDKNGDGKVSRDEFTGPEERFKARDKNGDGVLEGDELLPPRPVAGPGGDREKV